MKELNQPRKWKTVTEYLELTKGLYISFLGRALPKNMDAAGLVVNGHLPRYLFEMYPDKLVEHRAKEGARLSSKAFYLGTYGIFAAIFTAFGFGFFLVPSAYAVMTMVGIAALLIILIKRIEKRLDEQAEVHQSYCAEFNKDVGLIFWLLGLSKYNYEGFPGTFEELRVQTEGQLIRLVVLQVFLADHLRPASADYLLGLFKRVYGAVEKFERHLTTVKKGYGPYFDAAKLMLTPAVIEEILAEFFEGQVKLMTKADALLLKEKWPAPIEHSEDE
jgi:hypothetical protein